MNRFDRWIESRTRAAAHRASRRGFLTALATALVGGAALPLLPVARAATDSSRQPGPDESKLRGDVADPTSCNLLALLWHRRLPPTCCGGSGRPVRPARR
jgi:methylamine dehydrogenase light chain